MAKRATTPSFVVELRLQTSPSDERKLNTAIEGRTRFVQHLSSGVPEALVSHEDSPKAYRSALRMPKGPERTAAFKALREHFQFKDSALQSYGIKTKNACHLSDHLDTHVTQKVATRAFEATARYAVGKGGRPRFKRMGWLNSLESKTNASGIRYRDGGSCCGGACRSALHHRFQGRSRCPWMNHPINTVVWCVAPLRANSVLRSAHCRGTPSAKEQACAWHRSGRTGSRPLNHCLRWQPGCGVGTLLR